MKTYMERCFILLVFFLFIFLGLLLVIAHQKSPAISYGKYSTAALESNVPVQKIVIDSYQKDSPDSIGVLITAKDIDSANSLIKLKGGTSKKHKIGKVIAANIPQNQIDSLSQDSSVIQILPNRQVKAFSVDVSEVNAEILLSAGITGKGVKIAVLDTGVYSDNVAASNDFTGEGINDDNGHGTKIAEIILAMAPDAQLINAKVLDKNGLGSEASVIAGINYAVEQDADVISLSLGGLFNDLNSPLVAAVEDAVAKGVTVVAASGNCRKQGMCGDFVGVATPGNAPNVITVGSVDGENSVDYSAGFNFDNYIKPDVTAPVSANSLSGTSASTPFVAGAAALLIERYNAKPVEVKSLIEQNAKDLGASGKDTVFGSGKLNLNFLSETIPEIQPIVFEPVVEREASDEKNVKAFFCSLAFVADGDNGGRDNITIVDMLGNEGIFNFSYSTESQEDRIIISYEGNEIFNSGCVGTISQADTRVNFSGTDTKIKVNVTPNCAGGSGTAWSYRVLCLDPVPISLNVPMQTAEQNQQLTVDLSQYSNLQSIISADGICSKVGTTQLQIGPSNNIGLTMCNVTVAKSASQATNQVLIQIAPPGPLSDLSINPSDIKIGSLGNAELTVHNIGKNSASNVDAKIIEIKDNKIIGETVDSVVTIQNGSSAVFNGFSRTFTRGSKLVAVVDYNNEIPEASEANNRAETVFGKQDVYLNVITNQFENEIKNYLTEKLYGYNILPTSGAEDIVINVNYTTGTKQKGCSLGNVYFGGKVDGNAHAGLIFTTNDGTKTYVNVCGSRIEGLINALKRMNKNDLSQNKDMFFDKTDLTGLAVRDYFARKTVNAALVINALNGVVQTTDKFVQTNNGVLLRMKNYKPIVSQSFLDYLFNINNIDVGYLPPVIMAGGLWSDITAWDEAGREISIGIEDGALRDSVKYLPRDVWLIELTGGPGTECDTCPDYTYNDVVNKYWPAAVGGVLKLTGKSEASYVGHSNGGRVALDAMKNYSIIKNTISYLSDGTPYTLAEKSSVNPITNFIGVGVPGAFAASTIFTRDVDEGKGDKVVAKFNSENRRHIKLVEVGSALSSFSGKVVRIISLFDEQRVSTNLLKTYIGRANSTSDSQPGTGISVPKVTLIFGTVLDSGTSDGIVPRADAIGINSSMPPGDKMVIGTNTVHAFQREDREIKRIIKERLE